MTEERPRGLHAPSRALMLLVVSIALAHLMLSVGCGGQAGSDPAQFEETYDQIVSDVPIGSTSVEISSYLDSRDIPHGPPRSAKLFPQLRNPWLQPPDLAPETQVIQAYIFGEEGPEGREWQVFFVLDDSGKLVDVFWIEFGPDRV